MGAHIFVRPEQVKAEFENVIDVILKVFKIFGFEIINYVDLLKKEPIDNPKALEYLEVLDRKSQRLKKLPRIWWRPPRPLRAT